jgi:hypothetical protein
MLSTAFIEPDWSAPENVRAVVTMRLGGCSKGGFSSNNLANHVGDDLQAVENNRTMLAEQLGLPAKQFCWLNQVHGHEIVTASAYDKNNSSLQADGCDSTELNIACVVLTADCLPVLLCNLDGTRVSAVHAGWRGLAGNILPRAVARYPDPGQVIAWLGPAIGPSCFEVGEDVYDAFVTQSSAAKRAFVKTATNGKWLADLYCLARHQLQAAAIAGVYGGGLCTYTDAERFYSYRRDGVQSGRMASLIWRSA